ncbi:MAG: ABC transporter ATP-binding protein [Sphingobacteriales bacterium]|jgi:ABC-type multidrug transport system ATPase subunit|nr:MAG: ABC transporter ATP-binding protein [Sphingobacteriales bacterium]
MNIQLDDISKKFGKEWIFKHVNYQFESNNKYAIIGHNGSGKSTLLKIIANGLMPTSGKIAYSIPNKKSLTEFEINQQIAFTAPYISIIEEFSLREIYNFHTSLKKLAIEDFKAFIQLIQLEKHQDKLLKNFSSGMKQRVKLALTILSDTQALLLDEPTSNLDTTGIEWYHKLIEQYSNNRIIIIGSNQAHEYSFCNAQINVLDFK